MTIVVAVKKDAELVLAADSLNHFGDLREIAPNHVVKKVMPLGDALIAVSGWALYANILEDFGVRHKLPPAAGRMGLFRYFMKFWKDLPERYPFVNEQCDKDHNSSPFGDLHSEFLLINPRGIFKVCSDLSIAQFQQYTAIGSGADFALGALHALYDSGPDAETLARRAIDAAIRFDSGCGGEASVFKIKNPGSKDNNPHRPRKGKFPITPEFLDDAKREKKT